MSQAKKTNERGRFLTVAEVAEWLNVGRNKVYNLIESGRLRSNNFDGPRRIPEDAVHEFLRETEVA